MKLLLGRQATPSAASYPIPAAYRAIYGSTKPLAAPGWLTLRPPGRLCARCHAWRATQHPRVDLKSRPAPITVTSKDSLLAVIHGVKSEGWRSAIAKQTYLLKNAVGENFETQSSQQSNAAKSRFRGDVIHEKLDGTTGVIYFTGAKYAWHPII